MAESRQPREVFLELIQGVTEGRWKELPLLYAERTDVTHPMSPYSQPPLRTRDELRAHFGAGATAVDPLIRVEPVIVAIHETTDPEVVVGEFAYRGESRASGEPFVAPCIFVLRVREGEIVESHDYVDHVTMARARGTLDELVAAIRAR
jgi:ketosteroid isomerase-like protein